MLWHKSDMGWNLPRRKAVEDKRVNTNIEYRPLGNSGLIVSTVGLGCNNFGRPKTRTESQEGTNEVITAALDAGITLLDTADIYGGTRGQSETLMGNALKGRRDEVVLATKFGMNMDGLNGPDWGAFGSRRYIRRAIETSLTRLQTDWIDLYQYHRPDGITPIDETIAALDELIAEGKIRYIGHSNLDGWQIADAEFRAQLAGHPKFISAQNEYSLIRRGAEAEVLPAANAYGLGFLPFFPLFNGLFTGKYSRSGGPADGRLVSIRPEALNGVDWDAMEKFQTFCDEREISMLAATFGWLLAQAGVTSVIAGATQASQVVQNAEAGSAWKPSPADVATIAEFFPTA
jgi:aryl-alcohol dehydrogenase-like predicted oxidoreductase